MQIQCLFISKTPSPEIISTKLADRMLYFILLHGICRGVAWYNICLPKVAEYRLARGLDMEFVKTYICACIKKGIDLNLCFNNKKRQKMFLQTWVQAGKTVVPTHQLVFTKLKRHLGKKLFLQNLVNGAEMSSSKRVTQWLFSLNDDNFVIDCISQNLENGYGENENLAKLHFLVSTNKKKVSEFHKDKRELFKKELWG